MSELTPTSRDYPLRTTQGQLEVPSSLHSILLKLNLGAHLPFLPLLAVPLLPPRPPPPSTHADLLLPLPRMHRLPNSLLRRINFCPPTTSPARRSSPKPRRTPPLNGLLSRTTSSYLPCRVLSTLQTPLSIPRRPSCPSRFPNSKVVAWKRRMESSGRAREMRRLHDSRAL